MLKIINKDDIKFIFGNKRFTLKELKKEIQALKNEVNSQTRKEVDEFIKEKGFDIDNLSENEILEIENHGKERLIINLEKQKFQRFYKP